MQPASECLDLQAGSPGARLPPPSYVAVPFPASPFTKPEGGQNSNGCTQRRSAQKPSSQDNCL